ncbi:MAG: GGDEF domain-containing protein [Dehalococcoidia bacterium]
MSEGPPETGPSPLFRWLFEMPIFSERTMRMEALIARLRLMVIAVNSLALAFLVNTDGMNVRWSWILVGFVWAYALPVAMLEPYKRWSVFRGSLLTATADTMVISAFVMTTGGWQSPFFALYYLSILSMAMRFELRQTLAGCGINIIAYSLVYLWGWERSVDAFGELFLRDVYMYVMALGAGHLAREENRRSRQVEQIERLNAENAKLLSRNERAARTDRLTGLLNRAYFEKVAHRELRRAKLSGGYLSLLFCDMDHLKQLNDELGHDVGDRVLKATGSVLKRCLKSTEHIGRYGGDEFVVVLPNQTRETAFDRAEQLIRAVFQLNRGLADDLQVGLSVGIATYPFDGNDYGMLLKLSDQAMYLAKRDGGNRVRTANDLRMFWEELPHSA